MLETTAITVVYSPITGKSHNKHLSQFMAVEQIVSGVERKYQ